MAKLIIINDTQIEVVSHKETFLVSNNEVVQAFGVGESTIREQKSKGEYEIGLYH